MVSVEQLTLLSPLLSLSPSRRCGISHGTLLRFLETLFEAFRVLDENDILEYFRALEFANETERGQLWLHVSVTVSCELALVV